MKKTVLILSLLALLLGGWVAALWLLPSAVYKGDSQETRYGVNEGLELVEKDNGAKGKRYVVEDADGNELFAIPLRGCLLDTRFRNGQLRFREQNSERGIYRPPGYGRIHGKQQECDSRRQQAAGADADEWRGGRNRKNFG